MDTQTVLEIIEMLDNKVKALRIEIDESPLQGADLEFEMGMMRGFKEFRDHLQEYIESQVNQVEN
jgi:hypothetical protein